MVTDPDAAAIAAAKQLLRQAVRLRRAARTDEQRAADDGARFDRVLSELQRRRVRRLACYLSTGTEPDALRLVAWALTRRIEVLLPVLTDGAGGWLPHPAWAAYEGPDRLRTGRAGILEPVGPVLPSALAGVDLMVLPGLAADPDGRRLGRGGGWYDRARSGHADTETWLLLNDEEVLDVVPTDSWDLPVDVLVTPSRTVTIH